MAGERNNKNENRTFGLYLACFLVLLILLGAAFLLLPKWRDYRNKEKELARLNTRVEELKAERNEKMVQTAELEDSPEAVEKVAREKFNLVRPGDQVVEYRAPGSSKRKR